MRIRWFGQSAFLVGGEAGSVAIDPYRDLDGRAPWFYPPIEGATADVLLITHEHTDHSGAEFIGGDPETIRSTAGTFETKLGEVVAVAAEHDDVAGTKIGPMTIFAFDFDGRRICHVGDLGQRMLRPEQRAAVGDVDILMVPVGGGSTMPPDAAAALVRDLSPTLVFPMHYRTECIPSFGPVDPFLAALPEWEVVRVPGVEVDVETLGEQQLVLLEPPDPVGV